jgi:alginate O-acetyltransferase complex protein AlgJ
MNPRASLSPPSLAAVRAAVLLPLCACGCGRGGEPAQDAAASTPAGAPAAAPAPESGEPTQDAAGFAAAAAAAAEKGRAAKAVSVAGDAPGWLFLVSELAHVGRGEFWESFPSGDPVAVISAYQKALADLGVDLVVVPVPAKATAYPEKFAPRATAMDGALPAEGAVFGSRGFIDALAAGGVKVVDLEGVYRAARLRDDSAKLFCAQDAHWSPLGAEMAADAVYQLVHQSPWLANAKKRTVVVGDPEEIVIKGDMADGEFEGLERESLTLRRAGTEEDGAIAPLDADPASPVLLIGDSHLRVFTDGGEFHTRGAGFRDHLQAKLRMPAAAEFNNGDGVYSPRLRVAREARGNPSFWQGKKLVVWCFSARSLTAPPEVIKWRELPPQPPGG